MWLEITDRRAWDEALARLPMPHVLQSWAWGELKSRWGWRARRWQLNDAIGQPRAMVQLLRRRVGPASVIYATKGPIALDLNAYGDALAFIERQARKSLAVWAKADGDLLVAGRDLAGARDVLARRGWFFSPQQVQFRNTMFTRVQRSDDELLAAMKDKWRYNVRLAARRGVNVREATEADFATLYDMYAETGRRDGFAIREAPYYFDVWRTMQAALFIAERDAAPLAGLALLRFANRAWYFYGMSKTESREHMPTYALQWHAMRWAREHGCDTYDWWGAPDKLDESDSMWGVYRWKQGFGAEWVEGVGAWDFAPSRALYRLAGRVTGAG